MRSSGFPSVDPTRGVAIAWAASAGLLAIAGDSLPVAMAGVLLIPVLAWAPGALLVATGRFFESHSARMAAALAISPLLTALPWAALRMIGLSSGAAARIILTLIALTAITIAARPGRSEPLPPRGLQWSEAWPALLWGAVVAALLLANPALAPRSDGWFHAGVVLQVAERSLPPEDPYFAGLPLLYFWGTHAWSALMLSIAPSLSVWVPLIAANVAAAAALPLAVAALARALGASTTQAAFASVLILVGWSPLGWLQVAGRAISGEVRGWAELQRLIDAGVDPMLVMLASGQLHASMAFQGDKSLVLTPFAMGLALFVLGLVVAIEPSRGARRVASFTVIAAAALFTHTVVGYALVLCMGAWAAWSLLGALRGQPGASEACRALLIAVPIALLLLAPYLASITAGKQSQLAFALDGVSLRTLGLGTGVFLAGAVLWWSRSRPGTHPILIAVSLFLALGLTTRLSENNQSKFFSLLAVTLAAPAALGLHAWATAATGRARLARAALLGGLLLPTPALAMWAFAAEHGQAAGSWHVPSAEAKDTFEWARANTGPTTLFADVGGARELFTITGRSVLWGGPDGERDWGHAPHALELRRRTVRALCAGEPLDAESIDLLATLARPVVVVSRRSHPQTARVRELATAGQSGYRVLREGPELMLASFEVLR